MKSTKLNDVWGVRLSSMDLYKRLRYFRRKVQSPVICMYHSVTESGSRDWGPWKYAVTPERFSKQISWIDRNHSVVPIDRVLDYINGDHHSLKTP